MGRQWDHGRHSPSHFLHVEGASWMFDYSEVGLLGSYCEKLCILSEPALSLWVPAASNFSPSSLRCRTARWQRAWFSPVMPCCWGTCLPHPYLQGPDVAGHWGRKKDKLGNNYHYWNVHTALWFTNASLHPLSYLSIMHVDITNITIL